MGKGGEEGGEEQAQAGAARPAWRLCPNGIRMERGPTGSCPSDSNFCLKRGE